MDKEKVVNGFKIIHKKPELSAEKKEEIKKDIVKKIYNSLYSKK